ncbi:hypothetical protein [Escherichia coli]|uniref:hypothetical protein n=1 Tax=Escherichia coli TaxID=562 RepID=UPI001FCF0B1D|nr:hypothetical protein [Escherichia coli]
MKTKKVMMIALVSSALALSGSARYSYQIDDLFAQMLFVLSQPGFCGHIHCSPMGNRDRRLAVMRFCR